MPGPGLIEKTATRIDSVNRKAETAFSGSRVGSEVLRRRNGLADRVATEAQRTSGIWGLHKIADSMKTRGQLETDAGLDYVTGRDQVRTDVRKNLGEINARRLTEGNPPLTQRQMFDLGRRLTNEALDKQAHAYVREKGNSNKMSVINDQIHLMKEGKPTTIDKQWLMKLEKERDAYKLELLIKVIGGLAAIGGSTVLQGVDTAKASAPVGQNR